MRTGIGTGGSSETRFGAGSLSAGWICAEPSTSQRREAVGLGSV